MLKLTLLVGMILLAVIAVAFLRRRSARGLIDRPEQYIGSELFVEPFYGYGWGVSNRAYIDVPEPFAFVLENIFTYKGRVVGGVGKITTENHLFSGHWVSFSMRHRITSSLGEKDTAYNVGISPHPFSLVEGGFPTVLQQGGRRFGGWGLIHLEASAGTREGQALS